MNIVYQSTAYSCMACVAAMITGEPLEQVFTALGHDGSTRHFRFLEIAAYLNSRGYHLGMYGVCGLFTPDAYARPALVIVERTGGNGAHAVYWPGDFGIGVMDPQPTNGHKKLTDYRVLEWWPVTRYED